MLFIVCIFVTVIAELKMRKFSLLDEICQVPEWQDADLSNMDTILDGDTSTCTDAGYYALSVKLPIACGKTVMINITTKGDSDCLKMEWVQQGTKL